MKSELLKLIETWKLRISAIEAMAERFGKMPGGGEHESRCISRALELSQCRDELQKIIDQN